MTDTDTATTTSINRSEGLSVPFLTTAYNQLCASYHAVDDFRGKLLGFLPLVTGGGLVLLTGPAKEIREQFFAPMGLFGIFITLGLLTYELYGIKRCRVLIIQGQALERFMFDGPVLEKAMKDRNVEVRPGQFTDRGNSRSNHMFSLISKPLAAALIYPAALAAWTYLALLNNDDPLLTNVLSGVMFVVGFAVVLIQHLRSWPKESNLRDPNHP
jgi:hypothetical protein